MLVYCDYIAHLISTQIKHHDAQGLLWNIGSPRYDLDANGAFCGTTKTIDVTDLNGTKYRITVEEVNAQIEELVDGVNDALKALTIRGE